MYLFLTQKYDFYPISYSKGSFERNEKNNSKAFMQTFSKCQFAPFHDGLTLSCDYNINIS